MRTHSTEGLVAAGTAGTGTSIANVPPPSGAARTLRSAASRMTTPSIVTCPPMTGIAPPASGQRISRFTWSAQLVVTANRSAPGPATNAHSVKCTKHATTMSVMAVLVAVGAIVLLVVIVALVVSRGGDDTPIGRTGDLRRAALNQVTLPGAVAAQALHRGA